MSLSFPARILMFHHPGAAWSQRHGVRLFPLSLPSIWGLPNRGSSEYPSAITHPPQVCPVPPRVHIWAWNQTCQAPFSTLPQVQNLERWVVKLQIRCGDWGKTKHLKKGREPSSARAPISPSAPQLPSLIPTIWGPPMNWQTPVGHIWFKRKKQGVGRPALIGSTGHTHWKQLLFIALP